MSRLKDSVLNKWFPSMLVVGSLIGLIASFWQVVERINMLKNPGAELSCNLNPVIDCGSVLGNRWAALFGFPNALIGIVMFTLLLAFGLAVMAKVDAKKWYWKVLAVVATILILFSVWFFGMSLFVIGKVCIFCLFIWAVSVPIFLYTFDWLILNNHLSGSWTTSKAVVWMRNNHTEIVAASYVIAIVLYLYRFRDYYL